MIKDISTLEFIDKTEHQYLKALFYGKAGSGKTTLAVTFPKPALLLDIKEEGYISVKNIKGLDIVKIKSLEDLETVYWFLQENKEGYKTVILDTISALQDLALEGLKKRKNLKSSIEKLSSFGSLTRKDWGDISSTLKPLITNFRDLDMNVVFLSHERIFNVDEEDRVESIEPSVGPRLMPSVASTVNASVDLIGNTFIREVKRDKKSEMQYCLRIGPHSYYITKIRKPRDTKTEDVLVDATYQDLREIIKGDNNE